MSCVFFSGNSAPTPQWRLLVKHQCIRLHTQLLRTSDWTPTTRKTVRVSECALVLQLGGVGGVGGGGGVVVSSEYRPVVSLCIFRYNFVRVTRNIGCCFCPLKSFCHYYHESTTRIVIQLVCVRYPNNRVLQRAGVTQ